MLPIGREVDFWQFIDFGTGGFGTGFVRFIHRDLQKQKGRPEGGL